MYALFLWTDTSDCCVSLSQNLAFLRKFIGFIFFLFLCLFRVFFSFVVHNSIADQRSSILCKLITAVTNTNKLHKHITVIDIDFEIQIRLGIKIEININETDTARQFVLFDKRAKFV